MAEESNQIQKNPNAIDSSEIASILGDTIMLQDPPLTVGVFGKWNTGKTDLLFGTRERMEGKSSSKNPKNFSVKILSLLYRLMFFQPVLNSTRGRPNHYLFVQFSILDYAGCDKMWAGIITGISNAVDDAFGKWAVKLFRAWHYKRTHLKPFLDETANVKRTNQEWKLLPCSAFLKPILILLLLAALLTLWLVFGVPKFSSSATKSADVATTAVTTVAAVGVAAKLTDIIKLVLKLAYSQAKKVTKMSKKAHFEQSLGFMGHVKEEIHYITSVVRYMGIKLDRNIRICLVIDDIDLLQTDQIMKLFQVVSLLHYSPNSLYFQILCMDPMIAANLIKKALSREMSSNVSGHAFLKKHIQFPFHIPPIDYRLKVEKYLEQRTTGSFYDEESKNGNEKSSIVEMDELKYNVVVVPNDSVDQCRNQKKENELRMNKMEEKSLVDLELDSYIDGNERALKRVLLSSQLAVHIMARRQDRDPSSTEIKNIIAWITFVDQWPYRISWIRQVIEDNLQLHRIDPHVIRLLSDDALLQDVYQLVESNLCAPTDWKNLLDLDNDPELFLSFLNRFTFTVGNMKTLMPYTTNLNNSLRRIIAHCSAKDYVKRKAEVNNERWLSSAPLENWTVEDVCFELKTMKVTRKNKAKYQKAVRDNNITGQDLFSKPKDELQLKLAMSAGDWSVFWKSIVGFRLCRKTSAVSPQFEMRSTLLD